MCSVCGFLMILGFACLLASLFGEKLGFISSASKFADLMNKKVDDNHYLSQIVDMDRHLLAFIRLEAAYRIVLLVVGVILLAAALHFSVKAAEPKSSETLFQRDTPSGANNSYSANKSALGKCEAAKAVIPASIESVSTNSTSDLVPGKEN